MNNLLKKDFSTTRVNVNIPRSKFSRPSQLKTSFNNGDLIPIYLDEVLPGDTWQMDTAFVCRMSTPIKPTMDNLYLDVSYFFVPNRLVWQHWKEFQGENKDGYWTQPIEYEVPQVVLPSNRGTSSFTGWGYAPGSLADYFGIPIFESDTSEPVPGLDNLPRISVLPFRAYALIWNEFYRDENLQEPCHIYLDDTTRYAENLTDSTDNYQPNTQYVAKTNLLGTKK